jgi:hypothetical protein
MPEKQTIEKVQKTKRARKALPPRRANSCAGRSTRIRGGEHGGPSRVRAAPAAQGLTDAHVGRLSAECLRLRTDGAKRRGPAEQGNPGPDRAGLDQTGGTECDPEERAPRTRRSAVSQTVVALTLELVEMPVHEEQRSAVLGPSSLDDTKSRAEMLPGAKSMSFASEM